MFLVHLYYNELFTNNLCAQLQRTTKYGKFLFGLNLHCYFGYDVKLCQALDSFKGPITVVNVHMLSKIVVLSEEGSARSRPLCCHSLPLVFQQCKCTLKLKLLCHFFVVLISKLFCKKAIIHKSTHLSITQIAHIT